MKEKHLARGQSLSPAAQRRSKQNISSPKNSFHDQRPESKALAQQIQVIQQKSQNPQTEVIQRVSNSQAPIQFGGLAMREFTTVDLTKNQSQLATDYKALKADPQFYISKYKGVRRGAKDTSGIPLFGDQTNHPPQDRIGWNVGHSMSRNNMSEKLSSVNKYNPVRAENSHALGHGDYGTDHMISAPPASQHQNTEQLAIEDGMREAAKALGQDKVRMKITDILDPKTGWLKVRRFKLLRKNPADGEYVVVFDHLMDGERKGITFGTASALKAQVKSALLNPAITKANKATDPTKTHDKTTKPAANDLTQNDLFSHQQQVRADVGTELNKDAANRDFKSVNWVGPGYTELTKGGGAKTYTGNQALRKFGRKVAPNLQPGMTEDEFFKQKSIQGNDAITAMKNYISFRNGIQGTIKDYDTFFVGNQQALSARGRAKEKFYFQRWQSMYDNGQKGQQSKEISYIDKYFAVVHRLKTSFDESIHESPIFESELLILKAASEDFNDKGGRAVNKRSKTT